MGTFTNLLILASLLFLWLLEYFLFLVGSCYVCHSNWLSRFDRIIIYSFEQEVDFWKRENNSS